jgi:hypothetical membrane protein
MSTRVDPGLMRLLAFGGVLAPLVFLGAVIVTAAGRPEYHHATQAISELGEVGARNAALMNYGGFLLYGALIVGLAVALHQGIRRGPGDWLGPLLLLLYGLAYIGVAFARCNPGCTGESHTAGEQVHFLLSRIIILTAVATPFVLYPRLAKDPAWTSLSPLVAILPTIAYLLFLLPVPGLTSGWQQRAFFGFTLGWVLSLALGLLRVTGKARPDSPGAGGG